MAGELTSLSLAMGRGVVSSAAPNAIGGVTIGQAGAAGTIYESYVLRDGDDFDRTTDADFLTPTNNSGQYMVTRHYGVQSGTPRYLRGSASLGGYEADPWHTGFLDANRGVVPSSFSDMIAFDGGRLKTKARRATSAEKLLMGALTGKNNLSSMVHMARRNMMRAPCIMEMRLRFPYALSSWDMNHPTFWLLQSQPGNGWDGLELDCEGFAPAFSFYVNRWVDAAVVSNQQPGNTSAVSKTQYRNYSFEVKQAAGVWTAYLYEENSLVASAPCSGGSFVFDPTRPFHLMMTSHILQAGLTQSVFDAAGDAGAEIECDYWRVWSPSSGVYRNPQAAARQFLADFNTDFSFDLGPASAVWGAGASGDVVEMIPNEDNSPAAPWVRGLLPASVTRTGDVLSGKITDQPGRLILARSYTPAAGDGCKPQPITICIGPRVVPNSIEYLVGQAFSFDVYTAVDCGDLHMGKVVSVSGLPAWATYNSTTKLVTGTPTDTGTTTITISGTNAVGQTVSKGVSLMKGEGYAYQSWNGPGWFDLTDPNTITLTGQNITGVSNKRSGGVALVAGGAAITNPANVQNGKSAARFARDTTNPARLFPAGDAGNVVLSQIMQGNDKPYTVIAVYTPTDANTGFIWSWSDTVDATNSQNIALVRRSASASSVRRQLVTATSNDVSWGAGQAANSHRIVAIKHTGTAVTIWDTSTTKAVDAAAQDVASFNSELVFRIGAAESNGSTDPTLAPTACAMDFFEIVIEGSAKLDADIQQAITDLAQKYAITLA